VALSATCIKNVKFKITKVRTSCQYVGFFHYSENLTWAMQNSRLGRMWPEDCRLDNIAALVLVVLGYFWCKHCS